ncbi:hypothetical protein [Streptomyces sp. NPDC050534]|uniref:hypothetical protein n=1 Tax=Streptomyces sp. NPDC050534 TaxID=3365625 RepID=UPI0037A77AC5
MSTAAETPQQPEMSDADRRAHELASYVRRTEPTPDLPPLPRDTAARRRALAVRGW